MEEIRPSEYFDFIKEKKQKTSDKKLQELYDNTLALVNKYVITGQTEALKKLIFQLDCIEKERKLVSVGIDTFVYQDDVELYIDSVAKNVVKIIELSRYEREIPDNIVAIIEKTKPIFDQFYVLFTDYTGKVERQVAKERRDRDPILFGTFQDKTARVLVDRFYFLGDWVDDFCDLTLTKMVSETKAKKGKNIEMKISTPKDVQELKKQLARLQPTQDGRFVMTNTPKKTFWQKIRGVFRGER